MEQNTRYNRQTAWFGEKGQQKISEVKVAIVGTGGVGSHVIQQLAYLGVKNLILIDSDTIKETNLNRLIGANKKDIGKNKVEVAKRLAEFIEDNIQVSAVAHSFLDEDGLAALKQAEFVFGCVDKDGARLLLTEFCKAYKIPYLDIATEILEDEWGGRLFLSHQDIGCLVCANQLNQEDIHRDLSTPEDRSVDDRIYGLEKNELSSSGPSVVTLNGILASLATTEFLVYITGVRQAKKHLEYRGLRGPVFNVLDNFMPDCYYCSSILGTGDEVNMEKYIKQGINKILR